MALLLKNSFSRNFWGLSGSCIISPQESELRGDLWTKISGCAEGLIICRTEKTCMKGPARIFPVHRTGEDNFPTGRIHAIRVLMAVILLGVFIPLVSAEAQDSCPGCGMVWKDTCAPFENNNETAYNEEILAAFTPVAGNQTQPADLTNLSWSDTFRP